jgi:ABC-2 type transport system permease protein
MHNVFLIARREYLERVRARSFMVMTILIPLFMGGAFYSRVLMNRGSGSEATHVAVVTQDTQFGLDLQSDLQSSRRTAPLRVDVISPPAPDTRDLLNEQLKDKDLDGYLWVTPSSAQNVRPRFDWVPKSKADIATRSMLASAIRNVLTREQLTHSGMGATQVDALLAPVSLDSSQAGKNDSTTAAYFSAVALFMLMYFVILFYGMNVARSIIEEKTSRIFEVMLAMIRPEEMMAGKILGVGAVGLTQVGIWITAGVLLFASGLVGAGVSVPVSGMQVGFFVLFFLLGYLLYSSIAAALGAMTSSEQELQQMNIFMMLPLIACTIILVPVLSSPDGTIARVFSLIPFCTPLIMYVRIAVHQPPAWQIALSVIDLVLTIYAIIWITSRIYRVGVLMYGKRPNLPEIVRWLKYS